MKSKIISLAFVAGVFGGSVAAVTPEEALQLAINSGVCGELPVAAAILTAMDTIEVTCGVGVDTQFPGDVEALFPIAAGPAAAVAGGLLLVLAAGGGGSTSDTQ